MHMRKPHPEAGLNISIHEIAGVNTWLRNAEFVLGLQLVATGLSRMWFFKDRVGHGPEIRSKWWLRFNRDDGYMHDVEREKEEQERRERKERERVEKGVRKEMDVLLRREEGATRGDLLEIVGATEEAVNKVLLKLDDPAHR